LGDLKIPASKGGALILFKPYFDLVISHTAYHTQQLGIRQGKFSTIFLGAGWIPRQRAIAASRLRFLRFGCWLDLIPPLLPMLRKNFLTSGVAVRVDI
jgi:hypothetical protein